MELMSNNSRGKLRHLFSPHEGNNFRAKLLHNSGIFALIGIFLSFNLLVRLLDNTPLHILGFNSSITIDEVMRLTNEQRVSQGLSPLRYNETLADAARRKAANMFEENYWAHNSPSGISPWYWFKQAGYNYVHAGENLAKDFGSSDRMISAWMNSPTHRENIVSPEYQEIGLAVVPGTLLGQETVLVVQLFGSATGGSVPQIASVGTKTQGVATKSEPLQIAEISQAPQSESAAPASPIPTSETSLSTPPPSGSQALFNEFSLKRSLSIATTVLLLMTLLADLIIAENRSLSRRVGKNWAHIVFINVILILVTIVQAGRII